MMFSTCLTRTAATAAAKTTRTLSVGRVIAAAGSGSCSSSIFNNNDSSDYDPLLRWKSSSSSGSGSGSSSGSSDGKGNKKFRPKRAPTKGGYYARLDSNRGTQRLRIKKKEPPGKKDPNDISTSIPKIDKSQIRVRDTLDADSGDYIDDDDDLTPLGTLMGGALRALRAEAAKVGGGKDSSSGDDMNNMNMNNMDDIESQLRTMDFFTSADGSTEDLVGARRAVAAETYGGGSMAADEMLQRIDRLVDEERFDYMELPHTEPIITTDTTETNGGGSKGGAVNRIPHNQLAHGDWGEMLIRTDRVSKMWRGGRVVSFRALVIGGNLRGCGGFGLGKAFEPEDAVEIACRMAKRNIFFVDRYRGRSLTRDLVGRQNSCKVVLRATTNGLRGNPLCCEILKMMGITNVVAKAHGSRNHYNVVRATYKALLTHESLDEIALKRGLRLVNLQRAKRLGI